MQSTRRRIGTAFGAILCLLLLCGHGFAQGSLQGGYNGVGEADGARLEVAPEGDGFTGRLRLPGGGSAAFEADRRGELAHAVFDLSGRTVLMEIVPLPYGAEVSLIPFDGEGRLVVAEARLLPFLRDGLDAPEAPEGYVDPPPAGTPNIAANSFLASYAFWRPDGVAAGYEALSPKFQTLMRLFPAVQLDVLWKLCLSRAADRALGVALRGISVGCAEIVDGIARSQQSGRFDAFKTEVADQRDTLRLSVRCADGYVVARSDCERVARDVAAAATSLDTVETILARYR